MPQSGAGYAGAQVSAIIIIIIMSNSYRVELPQAYCSGDDQSCRDYIIFTKVYQASEDIRK
jgi:1,4-dihydroxy-2-naphthoyl-CoA synthase